MLLPGKRAAFRCFFQCFQVVFDRRKRCYFRQPIDYQQVIYLFTNAQNTAVLVTNFFLEAKYDSDLYIFFTWNFAVLQVAWRRRKDVIYHVPHKQTGINDYPASKQADAMTTKSTTQQEQILKRNVINHALTPAPCYPQIRKSRHSKAHIHTHLQPLNCIFS